MRLPRGSVKHCENNRRKGVTPVGVVLRVANQNPLIAGGNHTFIHRLLAARYVANITCAGGWCYLTGVYVGVVPRAANQNLLIAGGNHTIISSAILPPATFRI